MILIALRDFRNVPVLGLKDAEGNSKIKSANPDHIPQGTVFEIGGKAKDVLALSKTDPAAAQIVAQLIVSRAVGDAEDPKVVAAVQEEMELARKREENLAKLQQAADTSHLGRAVLENLKPKK